MSEIFSKLSSTAPQINTGIGFKSDTTGSQSGSNSENNPLNESFSGIVTSFAVYRLLTDIVKPFTSLNAYSAGLIDANGNLLKKEYELMPEERMLLSPYIRLIIGIKRLVQALPANRLKSDYNYIATAAKAMAFECAELGGDEELFLEELQKSLDVLLEDGEGAAGGIGNVMGDGFSNPQVGDPNPALAGYSPPMNMSNNILRRKKKIFKREIQ